ncbi:MAG: RNA polymerase factor sigma-54 [Bacteroidales bacterium]|nr:RNA polymerase factor sigma-54 [Bacteroidales bacterium]
MLQRLSPQQIQLMRLLQVPIVSLEQAIKEEIERNPLLEDDEDSTESFAANDEETIYDEESYSNEEQNHFLDHYDDYMDDYQSYREKIDYDTSQEERNILYASEASFQDYIIEQFNLKETTENQHIIGLELIGNINVNGYMERNLASIVNDIAFRQGIYVSDEDVLPVLRTIQSLEPAGVGARNLQECLSIQLHRSEDQSADTKNAIKIVDNHFELFSKKHYNKIEQKLKISEAELSAAIDIISKLNPRPGNGFVSQSDNPAYIVPDFIVTEIDGKLSVQQTRDKPSLKVSKYYTNILNDINKSKKPTKEEKETATFIKEKADAAKWFIEAIEQRYKTLDITLGVIVDYQKKYFLSGDINDLRPMRLKDIAEMTDFDISTISRAINQKYIQTDFGTFSLRKLFSKSHIGDDGKDSATETIKSAMIECIKTENKSAPLSDEELTKQLNQKGFKVSRRTVTKYREQMNIPVQRLRKEIVK